MKESEKRLGSEEESFIKSLSRKRSKSVGAEPSDNNIASSLKKTKIEDVSKDRDELECAICADTYKDPKLLTCMHTFCNDCIVRMLNNNDEQIVVCPICRFVTQVADGANSRLCRNHIIQQKVKWKEVAMKRDSNELLCSDCEVEAPAKICTDCCWKLCEVCSTHHKRSARFRGHSIQSIEAVANEELIEKKPVCFAQHGQKMKFFCETCSKMACAECVQSTPHEGHIFKPLNENMEKRLAALQESISQFDKVCKQYGNRLQDFESFHQKAIEERDASKKQIEDAFAELEVIMASSKQKLLNWLDEKCEASDQALKRAKERVHHLKAMCQYLEDISRYPNDEIFDIVQDGVSWWEETVESMKSLSKMKRPTLPAALELTFLPAKSAKVAKNEQKNVFDVEIYARKIVTSDSFAAVKTCLGQLGMLPVDDPVSPAAFLFNEAVFMEPSGVIQLKVNDISKIKTEIVLSKDILLGNVSWSLSFQRKFNETSKKDFVATFLYCRSGGAYSPENCYVYYAITIKSRNGTDVSCTLSHNFKIPGNCGWPSFLPWADLLDPKRGFILKDSVSIEARIQILPYKGKDKAW